MLGDIKDNILISVPFKERHANNMAYYFDYEIHKIFDRFTETIQNIC